MKMVTFIIGIMAVVFYQIGYLQRKKKQILIFNATARVLYIIQYLLVGAYEGAVLDVAGFISSVAAQKVSKKYKPVMYVVFTVFIILSGALVYENIFSILPVLGILFDTSGFWIEDERLIRKIMLFGPPCWFTYNIISGAYGVCFGDILSMISVVTAIVKYDCLKRNNEETK